MCRVFSLNLANAKRDEIKFPLYLRMQSILRYLNSVFKQKDFDVLCLQELRSSGLISSFQNEQEKQVLKHILEQTWYIPPSTCTEWLFTPENIVTIICKWLGFSITANYMSPVNGKTDCFIRATIYNSSKWALTRCVTRYVPSVEGEKLPFTYQQLSFTPLRNLNTPSLAEQDTFNVWNVHAPVGMDSKVLYWANVMEDISAHPSSPRQKLLIGDMNKFNEEFETYTNMLKHYHLIDLIPRDTKTFYSFTHDCKEDGIRFESSLDAAVVPEECETCFAVNVIPTIGFDTLKEANNDFTVLRPTDHFGLMVLEPLVSNEC